MCKHILFNDFNVDTDLETLMVFNSMTYDDDGFGAIIRTKDNDIETIKGLSLGVFYIELMKRVMSKPDIATLVVHHRTSTNKVDFDHTHPFSYKDHYMTHNGVISIPIAYATKTSNDSEQLLHHLIDTNYETRLVNGYYSCFILNKKETIVVVDGIAPIYTDGRVYSSHKLSDSFVRIECKKLVLNPTTGQVVSDTDIEVSDTPYGKELVSVTIGNGVSGEHDDYDKYFDRLYDDYPRSVSKNVLDFYDTIDDDELFTLQKLSRNKHEALKEICNLAWVFGLDLTDSELVEIYDMMIDLDVAV